MADTPAVARARVEAALAREKLLLSTHRLQHRVSPARLATDAVEGARERGEAVLSTVTDAARRRPGLAVAAAVGLVAFLARRPIGRALHRPNKHSLAAPARHALPRPSGDR